MFIDKNIQEAFDAIPSQYSLKFKIKSPPDILLPDGYNKGKHHMQSIQKTKRGELVVSGSASESGYVYLTSNDYKIVNVTCPKVSDFNHAGGCQVDGDILVVGLENSRCRGESTSQVLFYDIQDIRNPKYLPHLSISRSEKGSTAGAVALGNYKDKWLVLVANWNSRRLDFYLSNRGNLAHPDARFGASPLCSWSRSIDGLSRDPIDNDWKAYQNINMFTERSAPDKPWFIGMYTYIDRNNSQLVNCAHLYQVSLERDHAVVKRKGEKCFYPSNRAALFKYGSGFVFNELLGCFEVYACGRNLRNRCNKWALARA